MGIVNTLVGAKRGREVGGLESSFWDSRARGTK